VQRLLDLVFPPRCGGCSAPGSWFCAGCHGSLRRLEEPLCRRCGGEIFSRGAYCGCRRRLRALNRLRSAARYEGPLERAVHRFKYEGWRHLARDLGLLLAELVAVEGLAAGLVVAVPLHPRRQRRRGYNQARLLAVELRRSLRMPAPAGTLVRTRDTPPQVGLDRLSRLSNVEGAFEWRGPALAGAPVLLVDDVATTGATLEACAIAVKQAGGGTVTGLSLARVQI
jgi:ComF family protein